MDVQRLYHLLQGYATRSISPDEERELFGFVETTSAPELKKALRQLQEAMSPDPALDASRWHLVLERILATAKTLEPSPVRRLIPWTRVAVAAALTGLLITGAWLWTQRPGNAETATRPAAAETGDIRPAGNRATLTLAGGATIVLDSAHNGMLARQGNTTIIKSGKGQLGYQQVGGQPISTSYNTLTTPRGGVYQLVLPDGTRVWLNAASSITYPTAFVTNERLVKMTGEAYFEVAKNPDKPFKVQVNPGAEVRVLGTSFNINSYSDEPLMATTLLEGSIRFSRNWGDKNNPAVTLTPGQQIQLSKAEDVRLVDHADIDRIMAWRNGQFPLKGTDMATLMRQIQRWYDVDVHFDGPVPDKSFGGSISRNVNLSAMLEALRENGVECRLVGKTIEVAK